MQDRDNHSLIKLLRHKYFTLAIQILLSGIVIYLVYHQLRDEQALGKQLQKEWLLLGQRPRRWWLILPVLLIGVNWCLEALKWQLLVRRVEAISFKKSFMAVLTGQSLAFVTPQSIGDYLGRIWHLGGKKRASALGAVMMGRWLQGLVTLFFGGLGAGFVLHYHLHLETVWLVVLITAGLFIWVGIFYILLAGRGFFTGKLSGWISDRWLRYIDVLGQYDKAEIWRILGLAFARYLIFLSQCLWLFYIFELETGLWIALAGITWMFFAKTIMPVLNIFSDLGVREMAVIYFFDYFEVEIAVVIWATVLLWVLNILIPTLAGLLFIRKLKIIP